MDILNLEEHFKNDMNTTYKTRLEELLEEFKRGHYPNVLSKSAELRAEPDLDKELAEKLRMVDAICHSEIGEVKSATSIISELYNESSIDHMLLGELAFMCDFKLARRILSNAVKQMEQDGQADRLKVARGYLVLAEAEENLEKYVRAIKYFKKGLSYFQEDDRKDQYMILYLHFKIGMMYAMKNDTEESLAYHSKVIDMAGDENTGLKISSLVTIAKTYGSNDENEKAYPYLEEALELLQGSDQEQTLTHAEALTEMAFHHFNQSAYDQAVPYYEEAVAIYENLPQTSHRKLGMIYMQYAYCLEHMEQNNNRQAANIYEKAVDRLEKTKDRELLENAIGDVIAFFDRTGNDKKKRQFENRFVKMVNT
ncbi:tetratricopeptide repeat protein [Lentibacillus lipolyticus]|nr:tetratricopeptide repeat protein [Lentibacillus lipolyticus]